MAEGAPLLVIVNFIPPYDTEVATILAAPQGGRVRFRYQTKYAPTITNPSSLVNQRGQVVLRDRATGWFMPLRSFVVASSRLVGDVVYLTVHLSDTAAISAHSLTQESQLQQFNQLVKEAIGAFPNDPNTDLLNLILHESGEIDRLLGAWNSSSSADEVVNWGSCIKLIADRLPAIDIDFFKLVSISGKKGSLAPHRTDTGATFRLTSGGNYRVEVLQRTYTGRKGDSSVTSARALELALPVQGVEIQHSSLPILGKYDLLSFDIHVSSSATVGPQLCSLSVVRSNASRYGIEFLLDVSRSAWTRTAKLTLLSFFVASVVAYLASSAVSSALDSIPGIAAVSSRAVEKASVLAMLLFSTMSGFGTWISDRIELS